MNVVVWVWIPSQSIIRAVAYPPFPRRKANGLALSSEDLVCLQLKSEDEGLLFLHTNKQVKSMVNKSWRPAAVM
jgi:hypothetical protein